jgi:hypothetical protein
MKRSLFLAAFVAGLLASAAMVPCAADGQPLRTKGTVLILHNERAISGDIERVGDGYLVRREGELWLPASKVKCLCASWDEALALLRSQANLDDADERLRLARWCEQNGLFTQAVDEAKYALEMRPKQSGLKQYVQYLEHAAEMSTRPPAPVVAKKEQESAPSLDLSADALSLFVTKVQPILMNTCAQCHATPQAGHFQLTRISGIGAGWQRATQANMVAAVRQINLDNAELSPLLIKAISKHGTAIKAPLGGRNTPPFHILKEWVENTIANNPHLRHELNQDATTASAKPIFTASDQVAAGFASQVGTQRSATIPALGMPIAGPFARPGKLPNLDPAMQVLPGQHPLTKVGPALAGLSPVVSADYSVPVGQEIGKVVTAAEPPIPRNLAPAAATAPKATNQAADPVDPNEFNQMYHPEKN